MRLFYILVSILVFILKSVVADRLPDQIPDNSIFVKMDGKIYESGGIKTKRQRDCPWWMQQAHMFNAIGVDSIYIRPQSGYVYEATLWNDDPPGARVSSSDFHDLSPVSVRVHVEHGGHHAYYKAETFRIAHIRDNLGVEDASDFYPPKNYIYVARKKGPVYSAPMIDYTPHPAELPRATHLHWAANFYASADGLPELIPNNNIFVLMDGQIYKTDRIHMKNMYDCPFWLQQGHLFHMITVDSIYIRPKRDYIYEASLSTDESLRSSQSRTHSSRPWSVRVHIVREEYHKYYKAGRFELATVPHKRRAEDADNEYPLIDHIYIARRKGPVYCASLIAYDPPRGHLYSDEHLHLAAHE